MPGNSSDTYIQDTQAVLTEFVRVFKLYLFYAENHPATEGLIKKLTDRLTQLSSEIPLRLNLSKDEIFLGAVPLDSKDKNVMEFCHHLNRRRIYSLTIMPGFTEKDTSVLVKIISKDPKQIRRMGGVRKQLLDQNITCFDITEYFYDATDSDLLQTSDNETLLVLNEEILKKFQLFLQGNIENLGGDEEVFVEFLQSPVRLAELVVRTFTDLKINENEKIIRFIQESMSRLCRWVNQQRQQDKSLLLQKIALSLLNQRFDLGIETLVHRKGLSKMQEESIAELTDYLTDDELLEMILKKSSPEGHQNEWVPLISELLIDKSRIDRLTQKYIALLERKKKTEMDQLEMKKLLERFRSVGTPRILSDSLGIMLELFENEIQSTVQKDILGNFERFMSNLVQNKDFDTIIDILQTLEDAKTGKNKFPDDIKPLITSAIQKFVSKENIARLIGYLENSTGEDEDKIIRVLSLPREDSTNQILEIFINTSKIMLRRPLSRVLVLMGNLTVEKIADSLSNTPEEIARELIAIVGQIHTKESMECLKKIYPGLSSALRQQAVSMIGEFQSQGTRDWLIERIKSSTEDSAVQLTCLDTLGKIGDPPSIQILREVALGDSIKKDTERILQHRAIQWLGRLNVTETVPELIRLFRKGRWFPNKKRDQLKIVIAQTLWKMNDMDARQVVRDGCKNMRGSVRRICQTLVSSPVISTPSEKKDA